VKLDPSLFELVAIDGELALLVRLGRRPLDPISEMEPARRKYQFKDTTVDLDALRLFLSDATQVQMGARVKATRLTEAYVAWCERAGDTPMSRTMFCRAMKARGFRQKHSNGHWWLNLALREHVEEPRP
jgi:hypothetical protein